MQKTNVAVDIVVYSMILGGILLMTKNSNGSALVSALFNGYDSVLSTVTGQTGTTTTSSRRTKA